MVTIGIEDISVFAGRAYVDVRELAEWRQLDLQRFNNLMVSEKSVALPSEDPVTFAVNAATPLLDRLDDDARSSIDLLITCTESGIDFGKSLSTYVHDYLKLGRGCRLFELKQACYSGAAGLQVACAFVAAQGRRASRALVISTDISRFQLVGDGDAMAMDWRFAEPSGGAGAVALLVSNAPYVLQMDHGASGYYSYEVMDTCRPVPDSEAGDADLSLMSYLDCCQHAFAEYRRRVPDADYRQTFDFLAFHTPFGGMVRGAHRTMLRRLHRLDPAAIDADFDTRVADGLVFCRRVGNIMGGTLFLALLGILDHAPIDRPKRIGCFAYGSGCASEFFSGVVTPEAQRRVRALRIDRQLDHRDRLSMEQYQALLGGSAAVRFGTRNVVVPPPPASDKGPRLHLTEIRDFHRKYAWL